YYAPGQSGVAYAAGYRLKSMGPDDPETDYNESVPLMIPTNFGTTFDYVGQDIMDNASRLCFSCHNSAEVFDEIPGVGVDTNFKSAMPDPPLVHSYSLGDSNQHILHAIGQTMQSWDSDWDTGTTGPGPGPGYDTLMTCSSCHNVHGAAGAEGSTNEPMIRDGSLAGRTGYGFSYVVEDVGIGGYPVVTSDGASLPISVGAVFRNGNDMCSQNCHQCPTPSGTSYDATDSGSGTYLEYYRAVGTFNCSDCHAYETEASHPTHADSSGKGVDLGCYDCHDSSHANNTVDFPDGPLSTTTTCDDCHSSGGAYDGAAMAKAGWAGGIYDATTMWGQTASGTDQE
ncbi:MAG: cytochrome c3 family protein, partial [Deltaproteobacteria bacterium]|nr:cytochrome c3 family protein [Deltaproteobacteria bacterium]